MDETQGLISGHNTRPGARDGGGQGSSWLGSLFGSSAAKFERVSSFELDTEQQQQGE